MSYRIDEYDNSIVLEGFQNGISDSPFTGIADMRNMNITSTPGEGSVNFRTTQISTPDVGNNHIQRVTTGSAGFVALATGIAESPWMATFGSGAPTGVTAGQAYIMGVANGTTGWYLYRSFADYDSSTNVNISGSVTGASVTSVEVSTPTYGFYDRSSGAYYWVDSNGRAWITPESNGVNPNQVISLANSTLTNGSGNGIVVYKGFCFVFRDALIDYLDLSTGSWTYGWQTMNTAGGTDNPHMAIIGQDDAVYYCDGSYVGSFYQVAGATFDPTDNTTYVWNSQALALPSNDVANCLAELGLNLLVGGQRNAIYPWNRIATSFSYPILLAENLVQRMVTVNTNTYIFAGQRGRIYITNGSQASIFKKVPDYITGTVEPYFQWGDATYQKNQLYFGVRAFTNSGELFSDRSTNGYGAVWAIDLDSGAMRMSNQLSTDDYTPLPTVIMPIYPVAVQDYSTPNLANGVGLLVGFDEPAIDVTYTRPYASGQTTIDFDLIPIGTFDKPRNNARIEYKLTKPMVSGDSVTLYYRLDFSESWTQVLSDSTAGSFSNATGISWANAQWLQVRAQLTATGATASNGPSYTRLKEVRLTGFK